MARRARGDRGSPRAPGAPAIGALRWSAAAGRRRAGARVTAERDVRRRADGQPRLRHGRRDPLIAAVVGRPSRPDDGDGHARRARGGDRRPRAVPRRRRHRARHRCPQRPAHPRGAGGGERPMIAVALKGLAARKVRALLTAFAVVIGVSMVSGTFILTDTMQKTFDGLFDSSYAQTDAVIGGKEIVKGSTSGSATVPDSLLTKVSALPEVKAAGGTIGLNE